ncbi:putative carboxylesterase family protein [Botrytis cinerea BcDW1]|uniref:Carboxylic ester hydrolase n=1 Tax=Botryotinia fuckeliana (strain BcDW1) TaxID=1290391 RepID=M7U1U6_BOTF1|nr:putative carboxylesterase family protein [Botrytis cinerea BcDW1]
MKFYSSVLLGAGLSTLTLAQPALPLVDLGYAVHQATLNASGSGYFNFSNIRYGQAPTGHLRFSPSLAPVGRNRTINDGQNSVTCPNATPAWVIPALIFLPAYFSGQNLSNYTSLTQTPLNTSFAQTLTPGPGVSEDCLFLDVIVPEKVFNAAKSNRSSGYNEARCAPGEPCKVPSGAPVLVWIYGGGYTAGSKTSEGNPASLVARSVENDGEGIVYVAMNYRLGLFGWLSGPNVTANVGLQDQRLALEWIQRNIHLFGGDASRVTVMGESAGGGSIMHHITSYGGKGSLPFQQAIPQSPGYFPATPLQAQQIFDNVLSNASVLSNVTIDSADDLRALPYETLYAVNAIVTGLSLWGTFTFGPAIDRSPNSYVPDFPLRMLANGLYHNVSVMVGHTSDEGPFFSAPFVQTQNDFETTVAEFFPTANETLLNTITTELYPPVFNGTYGYRTPYERIARTLSDFVITCNSQYIASTFSGFSYVFSMFPAIHGQDRFYTFFNGDTSTATIGAPVYSPVNSTVAMAFQSLILQFTMTGIPTAEGFQNPILYGNNHTVSSISTKTLLEPALGQQVPDPGAQKQCDFWLEAPYYTLDED